MKKLKTSEIYQQYRTGKLAKNYDYHSSFFHIRKKKIKVICPLCGVEQWRTKDSARVHKGEGDFKFRCRCGMKSTLECFPRFVSADRFVFEPRITWFLQAERNFADEAREKLPREYVISEKDFPGVQLPLTEEEKKLEEIYMQWAREGSPGYAAFEKQMDAQKANESRDLGTP